MITRIKVTQIIEIDYDKSKFTKEFLTEFPKSFYPFKTIQEHIEHIAESYSRGIITGDFLEGYGDLKENFGIKLKRVDGWTMLDNED